MSGLVMFYLYAGPWLTGMDCVWPDCAERYAAGLSIATGRPLR